MNARFIAGFMYADAMVISAWTTLADPDVVSVLLTVVLWAVGVGIGFERGWVQEFWRVLSGTIHAALCVCGGKAGLPPWKRRPAIEAEPGADPHKVWCTCKAPLPPSEPIEVHYPAVAGAEASSEVVGRLCTVCREERTPKAVRIEANAEADRRRSEANAAKARAQASALKPLQWGDADGYEEAKRALHERLGILDGLVTGMKVNADAGTFEGSKEEYEQVRRLRDECDSLRALVASREPTGRSVAPAPPLEIVQGDWVYQFGWYADEPCDEDEHEWESIQAWDSSVPVMELCTRCEVKRVPLVRRPAAGILTHPKGLTTEQRDAVVAHFEDGGSVSSGKTIVLSEGMTITPAPGRVTYAARPPLDPAVGDTWVDAEHGDRALRWSGDHWETAESMPPCGYCGQGIHPYEGTHTYRAAF